MNTQQSTVEERFKPKDILITEDLEYYVKLSAVESEIQLAEQKAREEERSLIQEKIDYIGQTGYFSVEIIKLLNKLWKAI